MDSYLVSSQRKLCAVALVTLATFVDPPVFFMGFPVGFPVSPQVVQPGETDPALRAEQFFSFITHTLSLSSYHQSGLLGRDLGLKKGFR